ncbi:uncharacterized protein [Panulirus ornatus]|uniref:uncharacterized protein n=1 Tax=Panulirus ornatus TaxID=150431 RepID=UPI003A8377EC
MATKQQSDLRKLQRNQLVKINKDELIDIILASTPANDEFQQLNQKLEDVMKEMEALKTTLMSPDSIINKNYTQLKARVDKQEEILVKQQQFLEALDRKEREANIVVLGVPDENRALDGATTDQEKLDKIWTKLGISDIEGTHRRLGREPPTGDGSTQRRSRPILLTLRDKDQRTSILNNANQLKSAGDNFIRIYIKRDVHPSMRKEWKRLRDMEAAEKARPENVGCIIRLDTKELIQEKLTTRSVETSFVIVGDMNARFGKSVRDILNLLEPTNVADLSYPYIPDDVQTPSVPSGGGGGGREYIFGSDERTIRIQTTP